MKYKNIGAAIHNFGASFISDMNFFDDDHVINDLKQIHSKGLDIEIDWLTGEFSPSIRASRRIRQSIVSYRMRLANHLASEKVELANIKSLVFHWTAAGKKCMHAIDDRGKEFEIPISENW